VRHILAGVGPRGADHDSARVPRALEPGVVEFDVIAALLHGVFGPEFDEVGIAVKNADDLDVMAQAGGRSRRDHGVGRRRGAACEEDRNALNLARAGRGRCWRR